jgi:RND family efflux transporter MFP subunit
MNEHSTSPLDALRIQRGASDDIKVGGFPWGPVLGGIAIVAIVAGIGFGAYAYWPSNAVSVRAVLAEGDGGAGGGLDASGYVQPRRKATISAKISGRLAYMDLDEGDHVEAGQIVARLDDTNLKGTLREAQARATQARAALENITPTYERYKTLRAQNAISDDQLNAQKTAYDAARLALAVSEAAVISAQNNVNDTIVRTPFSGVITEKVAQVGEIVAVGVGGGSTRTGIATVVDMDSLEVEVDVSENYIERVHSGAKATVVLNAYPQWEIPAHVIATIPTADMAKASVKVRIGMDVKDKRILPQMGAHVSFQTDGEKVAAPVSRGVTVPSEAVKADGKNGIVFIIKADDTVEQRTVALGNTVGQSVTVLSGLSNGDRLAVGDFAQLHDGVKVSVAD